MSKELIPVESIQTMARAIASSGLFGLKTPEQAMALMLVAQAEGMHPAIAARDYHIIEGRPALKADAMLARFQAAGGKVRWTAMTDTKVAGLFSHPQGGEVEIEWTMDMAQRARLSTKTQRDGGPNMWQKFPRQMLRSRVISEGIRATFPGVTVGMYTPEEVQDFDPPKPEPEIIDVTPPNSQPKVAAPKSKDSGSTAEDWFKRATTKVRTLSSVQAISAWEDANAGNIDLLKEKGPEFHAQLEDLLREMRGKLTNFGIAAE